jgi:hypothetical protein
MLKGIPTLKKDYFRDFTPQLTERYEFAGRWEFATRGDWLSLEDMAALWDDSCQDEWIKEVSRSRTSSESHWMNDAASLFRPERLSLFAGTNEGYERIYLLWLDDIEEPEVWAYDSNGESRYADLSAYLTAYISDDISQSRRHWKLAEIEQFGA